MNEKRRPPSGEAAEISLVPNEGWHCSHLYYEFDRQLLATMPSEQISDGRDELTAILDPAAEDPRRLQVSIVSGNKADFGLMLMDPNPLVIDTVHQRLRTSLLGPALRSVYSFTINPMSIIWCSYTK